MFSFCLSLTLALLQTVIKVKGFQGYISTRQRSDVLLVTEGDTDKESGS